MKLKLNIFYDKFDIYSLLQTLTDNFTHYCFYHTCFREGSDLIEAHCTQFVDLACVVGTRDGSTCIDVRPQSSGLSEHFWVLLVLEMQRGGFVSTARYHKNHRHPTHTSPPQPRKHELRYQKQNLTWFATTASCGSSGSAAARRACSDNSTVRRVIAAALRERFTHYPENLSYNRLLHSDVSHSPLIF